MDGLAVDYKAFEAYRGKKVFITGHTGFKGTWLTYLLKELGAIIKGVSLRPNSEPSHFTLLGLSSHIDHEEMNICNADALRKALLDFQPEYVFHLAAQALVKESYVNPIDTFSTNIMGSANLLEAVRACSSVRSLVYITSDKCYENLEWIWGYRENDRLGGHDPYSASKASAELIFSTYLYSYFYNLTQLGAASTRAGNVIGGGDWSQDRIVPDCIRAYQENRNICLRHPNATRPWQYVLEPISGYLLLGLKLREDPQKYSGAWNFGPVSFEKRTVFEVTTQILKQLGRGNVVVDDSEHQHEAKLLQLNCDKAHIILRWKSRWSVDQALYYTADWYKRVLSGEDARIVTKGQLQQYFSELL